MQLLLYPLLGVVVGVLAALVGVGGGFIIVPALLLLGFKKEAAVSTSFFNILFVTVVALSVYGVKGQVDWKVGLLLGLGSAVGAYFAATYLQPRVNEQVFRYILIVLLLVAVVSLVVKK